MGDLKGKVALVTGASGWRGFGRAMALRLARDGADVVVTDHPQARMTPEATQAGWKGLSSVVEEIQALGRQGLAANADITSGSDVEAMVNQALGRFGKIDILVNNAATPGPGRSQLVDTDIELFERILKINLTGTFLVTKAVAKSMIQKAAGGKIIMISSINSKNGFPGLGAYNISKSGQNTLGQTLALELAQYKINVNTICPGRFLTDIDFPIIEKIAKEKGVSFDEARKLMPKAYEANSVPLGRRGNVEEIAAYVAFLASSEADYITGQTVNMCGGVVMER